MFLGIRDIGGNQRLLKHPLDFQLLLQCVWSEMAQGHGFKPRVTVEVQKSCGGEVIDAGWENIYLHVSKVK